MRRCSFVRGMEFCANDSILFTEKKHMRILCIGLGPYFGLPRFGAQDDDVDFMLPGLVDDCSLTPGNSITSGSSLSQKSLDRSSWACVEGPNAKHRSTNVLLVPNISTPTLDLVSFILIWTGDTFRGADTSALA